MVTEKEKMQKEKTHKNAQSKEQNACFEVINSIFAYVCIKHRCTNVNKTYCTI